MRLVASLVLASLALLALQACTTRTSCSQVGCHDGVSLSRKVTIASPAVARLTLAVCVDGECGSAKLPVPGIRDGENVAQVSSGSASMDAFLVQTGSDFTLYVMLSNRNVKDGDAYTFKVVDEASGGVLLDLTKSTTYDILEPNGAACGPTCKFAML